MARASDIQHAFNAGELSTLMLGRQDIQKYAAGLYVCLNAIPLVQGAWTRRPGTAFLHQTKFHDKTSQLISFQYSVTQTYVLEFGEQYIRFFTNHGILTQTPQNITAITKASVAVVTYSGSDTYANGDRVYITGVLGMTQVNNREFIVANVNTGSNTFEIQDSNGTDVNSTAYDTYTSAGTVAEIFEVPTAFTAAEALEVHVTQSADTLFVFHPDYPPQKLVRVSALSWTISDLAFVDGPYDSLNTTATTLSPSAATGTVTVTASAVTGINSNQGFKSTDVGRLIRMQEGSTWGYCEVLTFGSTVSVTASVINTLTNTNAKVNWRLGTYSDTTGFPTCGTFHEDRLFMAGAAIYPQRLDGSKSGIYTDFSPSSTAGVVADDNAIAYTLNSDDVNEIMWLKSTTKGLVAGTARGEWPIRASTDTAALTPTDISGKPATHYGSASLQPVLAGEAVLFIERAGRKLRELSYVFQIDGFKAPDLSVLAEHITRPSITTMARQSQPQSIVWLVRADGVLLGFTYERDQDVVAWHRHELGGHSDAAGLDVPVVESVAVIPSPDADAHDELYVVVQRYINGGIKRYVEYMSTIWQVGDLQEDAFYNDCGWLQTDALGSTTVTGLWHLEGETVGIYADGAKLPEQVVTNGKITLTNAAVTKAVGYWYNSDGQTMPIEGGSQDGSAQGKIKRIHRLGLWLSDTLGLKIGPDADTLTELIVRTWGDPYGATTALFTGVVRERFEGDTDKLGQVYWRADGPFPANVLAVMPQYEVSDDS